MGISANQKQVSSAPPIAHKIEIQRFSFLEIRLGPAEVEDADNIQLAKMLIPKADRKKIHENLFREGVLVAPKK